MTGADIAQLRATMSAVLTPSFTETLMRFLLENRTGLYNACSYVTRRVKAAARFVREPNPSGDIFAMYVRSCDQTWACVTTASADEGTVSTRLVVWNGCVLRAIFAAVRSPETSVVLDTPVEEGLSRAISSHPQSGPDLMKSLNAILPVSVWEAAMTVDASDGHFRRWRQEGSEDSKRVDAMHVFTVDQTWARVQDGDHVRFVALRGYHLERLNDVFADRVANVIVQVSDI